MRLSSGTETVGPDVRSGQGESQATAAVAAHLEAVISRHIRDFFGERMVGNQPIMIVLIKPPVLFRPPAPDAEKPQPPLQGPWREPMGWRPIGEVSKACEYLLAKVTQLDEITHSWRYVGLTYLTIVACDWAAQLSKQMGCPTDLIDLRRKRHDFADLFTECQHETGRAERLTDVATDLLVAAVPPAVGARRPVKLRVEPKDGGIRVAWIAEDGVEIGGESLYEFALRVARPAAGELAREMVGLQASEARIRNAGNQVLAAMSPKVAGAMERAYREQRAVRIPICRAQSRNLPVDVSLYIDPESGRKAHPSVLLAARRAHEEFVLESDVGELYYFPPIQLAANITFSGKRWYTTAFVRQPRQSPLWCHPYTGRLRGDLYPVVITIGPPPLEAMAPISVAGRRLMGLGVNYTPMDMCGDLCVEGQEPEIRRLQAAVTAAQEKGVPSDLYELVRGVWNIVRIALTRAHQLNQSTPRAGMDANNMFYPVRDRTLLTGPLANRIFPYNPNRTVPLM